MANLLQRIRAAFFPRVEPEATMSGNSPRQKDGPVPPGGFSFGTSTLGGPQFTDAFQSRRAPSPMALVENYKSLIYAMVARNRNAVCRLPLRLYADGSRAQGRPQRNCDPIRVSRHAAARLVRSGQVSSAAVDQVYEIRNHPILDVLDRPDPYGYFTRDKLIGLMVSYCDVVGSAFFMPDGNGWRVDGSTTRAKGPPEYLWVLYSQYVLPVRFAGSPLVDYFMYFRDRIPYEQLLWFRQVQSLRDPYGSSYSPTYAGDMYRDQEDRYIAMFDQVLGMGPRPSMVVSAKDPMMAPDDTERKRFEQDLNRKQRGGMAGGVIVSSGAWDFTPTSYAPADLAGKELSEYDLHRLASIFDQPPTYYTVDTNLANLQAADEQHARQGVEPRCKAIAGTLTNLVRTWDPRLCFEFDPALPEDEESRQKVVDMKLNRGQITINQANEEGKYPPVPWGDEPWLPGTLQQPTMMQEAHEQELATAQAGIDQGDAQVEQGDAAVKQGDKAMEQGDKKLDIEQQKVDKPDPKPAAKRTTVELTIDRALDRLEEELAKRRAG